VNLVIKKMTNVTFRIQEDMLRKAREKAGKERKSLNHLVNQWLKNYSVAQDAAFDVRKYLDRVKGVKVGRKFTREEMNER